MASSFQVVLFLGLTFGLFIAGTMSQEDINAPAPNCAPGWTQYGSRCFTFFSKKQQWIRAEIECIKIGGNLASIHSADENNFLYKYIAQVSGSYVHTWIGGHDGVQEQIWQWSDGTAFDYLRWGSRRPQYRTYENCLEMNYSGSYWSDTRCYYSRPYVCAKDVSE